MPCCPLAGWRWAAALAASLHPAPLLPTLCRRLGRAGNAAFADAVSRWAFQERGVLRAANLTHRVLAGAHPGAVAPERYRVNDDVEFAVDILECADGACAPFK